MKTWRWVVGFTITIAIAAGLSAWVNGDTLTSISIGAAIGVVGGVISMTWALAS